MIAREFLARMANGDDGPDDRMDLTVPYETIQVATGLGTWIPASVRESTLYNGNMSIIALSRDAGECVRMMCDRHLIRKFYEYLSLLEVACVACHPYDENRKIIRRLPSFHISHPSYVWLTDNIGNYQWLLEVTNEIDKEIPIRLGPNSRANIRRQDRREESLKVVQVMPDLKMKVNEAQAPPQCLPWDYQVEHTVGNFNRWKNVVTAYRNWYCQEYYRFAKWTKRPAPEWFTWDMQEMELDVLSTKPEVKLEQRKREFIAAWNRIPESDVSV